MLVSLVKGKLSTDSESADDAAFAALAKYSRWMVPPAEDESSVDEEAQTRRKREEETETNRETRLGLLMRKVEESKDMCSGIFHAREGGNLRGEEQVMVAKWLLEDERKQLAQAQQREAEREALRREALQREAQQKEALIREARERSAQQQAAQAAQVAQAAKAAQESRAAQAAQEAQLLAAREASARAGDRGDSEMPEGKGGRAPHWLTGGTPEGGGPPKLVSRPSGERETTDLLSHFALSQAMSAQEVDAVGGLSNPPMSTEDLLSWQEADTPRDMPADWLGSAGLMDLNLDVPVVGHPGQGGAAQGDPTKKRPREDEDDAPLA